jgi:hypothetical protein
VAGPGGPRSVCGPWFRYARTVDRLRHVGPARYPGVGAGRHYRCWATARRDSVIPVSRPRKWNFFAGFPRGTKVKTGHNRHYAKCDARTTVQPAPGAGPLPEELGRMLRGPDRSRRSPRPALCTALQSVLTPHISCTTPALPCAYQHGATISDGTSLVSRTSSCTATALAGRRGTRRRSVTSVWRPTAAADVSSSRLRPRSQLDYPAAALFVAIRSQAAAR